MEIKMIRKLFALGAYTVLVVGLSVTGTKLYDSYFRVPDPAVYILNERNWVGQCVKTGHVEETYELNCSDLRIRVSAELYDRALRAWELSGHMSK